ncbi:MAG: hypothetical protein ABFD64_02865 [Armatimonadota bacterium]
MKDLKSNIGIVHMLDAKDITTNDTKSSLLDLQGFESAVIAVNVGAITTPDSTSYITPVLEESDTTADGSFAAVAATDIIGAFTKMDAATEDQTTQYVGYVGTKRYVRVLIDITDDDGGISHALVSVDGIVGDAHISPVTAPAPVAAT